MKSHSYYNLAKSYHSKGDFENAGYYYMASVKERPRPQDFVLPYYGLGQVQLKLGDFRSSLANFEKVLEAYPDSVESMKQTCIRILPDNVDPVEDSELFGSKKNEKSNHQEALKKLLNGESLPTEVLKFNLKESGLYCMLPWLTMAFSANLGGWIADTLVSKGYSVTYVCKLEEATAT